MSPAAAGVPVADSLLIDVVAFFMFAAAAVVVLACVDVDEDVDLTLLVLALVAVVSRPSPRPRACLEADRTVGWCLPLAAAAPDEDALALVPLLELVVKLERTFRVTRCSLGLFSFVCLCWCFCVVFVMWGLCVWLFQCQNEKKKER